MEETYELTKSELLELLTDSCTLRALEWGGVDNWTYYGEAIHECLKDWDCESIADAAEKLLLECEYKKITHDIEKDSN